MLLTWGPVVKLRGLDRSMGRTRVLVRFPNSTTYEERFGKAMWENLRAGDTVWDVGANIGFYTEQFAAKVGDGGRVVAFEPVPSCYDQMAARVGKIANVRMVKAGLGRVSGTVTFDVGDSDQALGRIVDDKSAATGGKLLELPIYTGDEAAKSQNLPAPTFVRIDVEGFELDVLMGMASLLRSTTCRDVFVEIYFGLLSKRGLATAPDDIVRLLREHGYKIRWVDSLHIHAARA